MPGMLSHWRRRVGAFIGGFEAGFANRRLKGFQPSRAHLNTLIAAAGADITARARYLIRNNGYAANAIESWAGNVVGAGIKPSSLIADAGAEGIGAEAVAGVDRRRRCRRLHRLLRPAAARRPRGVHRRRGVLPLPAAPGRGRVGRAAAAADAAGGDAAADPERGAGGRQCRPPGHRVRSHRPQGGLSLPAPASGRCHRSPDRRVRARRCAFRPSRSSTSSTRSMPASCAVSRSSRRRSSSCSCSISTTTPSSTGRRWRRCTRCSSPRRRRPSRSMSPRAPARMASGRWICSRGRSSCWSRASRCRPPIPPTRVRPTSRSSTARCCRSRRRSAFPTRICRNDMIKANYSNARLALLEFRRRTEAYQHAVMVWQLCRRVWARWMDTAVLAGALDLSGYQANRRRYLGVRLAAAEVGLGRPAEGRQGRDRADRRRPEEPHPGFGRARL